MLTIKECRKYLGEENKNLSDKEVEALRDNLYEKINQLIATLEAYE